MAWRRAASGRNEGLRPRVRSLVSSLGLAAAATLVVLHAVVLWDRVAHGRLTEPAVALRWLAAAAMMVALAVLRQRGVSLLWGRRALVFWLFVLLLHAGAAVPTQDSSPLPAPERLLFVVPAAVGPACVLALLLVLLARATLPGPAPSATRAHARQVPARRGGYLPALSSRPPPA